MPPWQWTHTHLPTNTSGSHPPHSTSLGPSTAALFCAYKVQVAVKGPFGATSLLWHFSSFGPEITHMHTAGPALMVSSQRWQHSWGGKRLFPEVPVDYPIRSNYRTKEASSSQVLVGDPCLVFKGTYICILHTSVQCGVPGIHHTSHLITKPPCEGPTQQDLEMYPWSPSCLLLRILTPWITSQTKASTEGGTVESHCICFPLFAFHTFPALGEVIRLSDLKEPLRSTRLHGGVKVNRKGEGSQNSL